MSLLQPIKPVDATHEWRWPNGSFRAWLKVTNWVYCDTDKGWSCIAKSIESLSGKVVAI